MLELPESYTISKQMQQILKGKRIRSIELLHTPHKFAFIHGEVDKYADYLEGQEVVGATYHGGMIEIDTTDRKIVFADGAYPKYYEDKKKFPQSHQMAIYFEDETAIFISVQMYGFLFVFSKGEDTTDFYISSCTKPSPLSEDFTFDYFKGLYPQHGKKLSAKAFLATEQRIPGLGNGVLQDILWNAGLDPRFDMREATEEDFQALYTSVRNVLKEMCDCGGRDTEKDLFGNKGGYVTQLSKNSLNGPCMKCGYEIHKANYMGGTVYFCEHCQRR